MKNISSMAWRGQSPFFKFSTVSKYTRQPMALQVRRNSWPFSYDVTQRMESCRCSGTPNLRRRIADRLGFQQDFSPVPLEPRSITPQLGHRKQKPQEWSHALCPRQLVMLRTLNAFVM